MITKEERLGNHAADKLAGAGAQLGAMTPEEVGKVDLDLVWDPPWDKSMMSEAAKLELNL